MKIHMIQFQEVIKAAFLYFAYTLRSTSLKPIMSFEVGKTTANLPCEKENAK